MKGLIIKGLAGFYYVLDESKNIYECKARGIFKNKGITLTVGDEVDFDIQDKLKGHITKLYPRKNIFVRPPISNVDSLVIVVSLKNPKISLYTLDKFLVMAEKNNIKPVICINKIDLLDDNYELGNIKKIYGDIYDVITVSAKDNKGLLSLMEKVKGKRVAFSGPSGVGKSTILNKLLGLTIETGSISNKTKRGKHTTRHVEIFPVEDMYIFDTPGFTSFSVLGIKEEEVGELFPEIEDCIGLCKYKSCIHLMEPKCEVIKRVLDGTISESRYKSYENIIKEIKEKKWQS